MLFINYLPFSRQALQRCTPSENRSFRVASIVLVSLVLSSLAACNGNTEKPITAAELTATPPVFPVEPPAYNKETNNPTQKEFARFAWRNFIYLNSPAMPASKSTKEGVSTVVRGTIDPKRGFVDSGSKTFYQDGKGAFNSSNFSENILVWESYAHRTELLPKSNAKLPDLSTTEPSYSYQSITVSAKDARFNNLDENSQIGQNQIFFPKTGNLPSTNIYDDYQILFEAKVNNAEYDFVKSFFNVPGATVPPTEALPPNSVVEDDSIEIKAAWRVLSEDMINSGRYHTAEAVYYIEGTNGPKAKVGTFGLIGLHIIRKMKNYPTFVFSTFQHVDNLVTPNGEPTGLYFLTQYDNLAYDQKTGTSPSAVINQDSISFNTVKLPVAGKITAANGYNIIPGSYTIPAGMGGPIAVKQPPTITGSTDAINAEVKAAMAASGKFNNSVWQYYELKGIQAIPINEPSGTGTPSAESENYYLANNVIESSQPGVQLFKGGVSGPTAANNVVTFSNPRSINNVIYKPTGTTPNPDNVNMGGCMGCHGNAKYPGGDFSTFNFLLVNKKRLMGHGYNEPDTVGKSSGDNTLNKAEQYMDDGM